MNTIITLLSIFVVVVGGGVLYTLYKLSRFNQINKQIYQQRFREQTENDMSDMAIKRLTSQPLLAKLSQHKKLVIKVEPNPNRFMGTIFTNDMKEIITKIMASSPDEVKQKAEEWIDNNTEK